MTEQEWLSSSSPLLMMEVVRSKVSQRKLQMLMCAFCKRIWEHFEWNDAPECHAAIMTLEKHADGAASETELAAHHIAAHDAMCETLASSTAAAAIATAAGPMTIERVVTVATSAVRAVPEMYFVFHPLEQGVQDVSPYRPLVQAAQDEEAAAQASLVRHLLGNPYRPYTAPDTWPSSVVSLAQALYNGETITFALHDALLDAGHAELAAHFQDANASHPKGCWALDVILGKE